MTFPIHFKKEKLLSAILYQLKQACPAACEGLTRGPQTPVSCHYPPLLQLQQQQQQLESWDSPSLPQLLMNAPTPGGRAGQCGMACGARRAITLECLYGTVPQKSLQGAEGKEGHHTMPGNTSLHSTAGCTSAHVCTVQWCGVAYTCMQLAWRSTAPRCFEDEQTWIKTWSAKRLVLPPKTFAVGWNPVRLQSLTVGVSISITDNYSVATAHVKGHWAQVLHIWNNKEEARPTLKLSKFGGKERPKDKYQCFRGQSSQNTQL